MLNPYLAIVVLFAVGLAVGAFNGLLIVRLGLNAFIVTLAMLILLRGVSIGLTSGQTLYDLPAPFLYLGNAHWLGLPASVWVSAALYRRRQHHPRLPPLRPRPLCDRRQCGGGARRRHSVSTSMSGRCSSSPAGSRRFPG